MSKAEKAKDEAIKKVKWFKDFADALPASQTGDSARDTMVDIESARLLRSAGEHAINSMVPKHEKEGLEKGISEGLEEAGAQIVKEKLTGQDPIRKKLDDVLAETLGEDLKARLSGGGRASEAELELARRDRAEDLNVMFTKFHEEVIGPLADQVKELADKGKGSGSPLTPDKAVDIVVAAQEKAKKLLEQQGYSVESVNVTKEDVKKILDEEETKYKERLAKDKEDWEQKSGAQVEIEKERIKATGEFLQTVTDRVFSLFLDPLKEEIHKAIKKGAFGPRKPAA